MAKSREDLLLERLKKKYEGKGSQNTNNDSEDDDELNAWEKFGAGSIRATENVQKGVLGAFEGIADTITGIAAATPNVVDIVGNIMGYNPNVNQKLEDFTKRNLTEEYMNSPVAELNRNYMGTIYGKKAVEASQSPNALPEIVEGVTQGIGSALGFAATGKIGGDSKALSNLVMGASAGGGGIQSALQEGADINEALAYGALSGATEVALENVVGGVLNKLGLGTNKVAGLISNGSTKVTKGASVGVSSGVSKALKNIAKNFGEEGLEEVLSDIANPLYQSLTYKQDQNYLELFEEQGGAEGLLESFLYGGITGGLFEGMNVVSEVNQAGGIEAYSYLDEAKQIAEINEQMVEAYLEGDVDKLLELYTTKEQRIQSIQEKFDKFVDQSLKLQDANRVKTALAYESEASKGHTEIAKEAVERVLGDKVKVTIDTDAKASSYNTKTNTITIATKQIYNINDLLETVAHETTHATTSNELVDSILENVDNVEGLMNEYKELYKEQNLTDEEIREEIAADYFGKLYLENLNELKGVISGMDSKGIGKIKRAIQNLFSEKKRPANYKKSMQLLKDGIEKNATRQSTEEKVKYKKKTSSEAIKNGQEDNQQMGKANGEGRIQTINRRGNQKYGTNYNFTFDWSRNAQSSNTLEKIYRDYGEENYKHEEFFKLENRVEFEKLILENKGYRDIQQTKDGVHIKLIMPKYFTPTMNDIVQENKKFGVKTEFWVGELGGKIDKKSIGFCSFLEKTIYIKISNPSLVDTNRHEKTHFLRYNSKAGKQHGIELINYLKNNEQEFSNIVYNEIEPKYHYIEQAENGEISENFAKEFIHREIQAYVFEGYIKLQDSAFQERINNEFNESLKKEFGLKDIRYKLTESKDKERVIDFKIDEDYDATKNFKFVTDNDEFNIKGLSWYQKAVDKFNEIEEKYNNDEITERKYESAIEKLTDTLDEEISNLEAVLYSFDDYDLEDLGQYENVPNQKQIIKILNYAHQIEDIINNELPITSADFSEHFDEESSIMKLFNVLQEPKVKVEETVVEQPVEETVENEPKNEPKVEKTKEIPSLDIPVEFDLDSIKSLGEAVSKSKELIIKLNQIDYGTDKAVGLNKEETINGLFERLKTETDKDKAKELYDTLERRVSTFKKTFDDFSQLRSEYRNKSKEYIKAMNNLSTLPTGYTNYYKKELLTGNKEQGTKGLQGLIEIAEDKLKQAKEFIEKGDPKLEEDKNTLLAKLNGLTKRTSFDQMYIEGVEDENNINNFKEKVKKVTTRKDYEKIKKSYEELEAKFNTFISRLNDKGKLKNSLNQIKLGEDYRTYADEQDKELAKTIEEQIKNYFKFDSKEIQDNLNKLADNVFKKRTEEEARKKAEKEAQAKIKQEQLDLNADYSQKFNEYVSKFSYHFTKDSALDKKYESLTAYETLLNDLEEDISSKGFNKEDGFFGVVEDIQKRIGEINEKIVNQVKKRLSKMVEPQEVKETIKETQPKKATKKEQEVVIKQIEKVVKSKVKVSRDSAKTVKLEAQLNKDTYYNQTAAVSLTRLAKTSLEGTRPSRTIKKLGLKIRLQFDNYGHELAIDDMFVAMNQYSDDIDTAVEEIYKVMEKGIQIKAPDIYIDENGKVVDRYREVYKPITDENFEGTDVKSTIENYIKTMIRTVMNNNAQPSKVAAKLKELESTFDRKFNKLENELNDTKQKYKEAVKQYKEAQAQLKDISKLNNQEVNLLIKEVKTLSKAIDNYEKALGYKTTLSNELKQQVAELTKELNAAKAKASAATNKMIKYRSEAEGIVKVTRGVRNYIEDSIREFTKNDNYKMSDEAFDKIAEKFQNLDLDGATEAVMNHLLNEDMIPFTFEDEEGNVIRDNVRLSDLYSQNQLEGLKQAIREDIEARMNNKSLTKETRLFKALTKLQIEKQRRFFTQKRLVIQNRARSIKKLTEVKAGGVQPELVTQARGIADMFKSAPKSKIENGEFRERIKEFWKVFNTPNADGVILREQLSLNPLDDELVNIIEAINGIPSGSEVTIGELELYNKFLKGIKKYIEHAAGNIEITLGEEKKTAKDWAYQGMMESKTIASNNKKESIGKIDAIVDPRLVFEKAGGYNENSVWHKLYEKLNEGETRFEEKWLELFTPIQDFNKKHKKFKKDLSKKVKISGIEATKGEFLSLHKLLNRKQAYDHIIKSGIEVDGKIITFEDEASVKNLQQAIIEQFDLNNNESVYKEYIDLSTEFFEKAKKTKVEVDEQTRGFTNVEDGEYFPIRVTQAHLNQTFDAKQMITAQTMLGAKNYSFNKSTSGTLGAVTLSNIDEVIALHGRQMAMYYGYAQILSNFNTIYNIKFSKDNTVGINSGDSMGYITKERFGKKDGKYVLDDYIGTLFRDIQGIGSPTSLLDRGAQRGLSKARGIYASYQLGANLKVIVTQVSALPASMKYIKARNLSKAITTKVDLDKYPMPTIGKYRNANKEVVQAATLSEGFNKFTDFFGKGMAYADQKCIDLMWKACLIQTNYDVNAATKIFEKAIRETQPNYNALQRSGLLRSKNELYKMMTMFTAQPSKNLTNIVEIGQRAKYKGKQLSKQDIQLAKSSIASLVWQGVMYTSLAYLFKWLLDKEEPEELNPLKVSQDFINDNIIGMVPFVNNLVQLDYANGKFIKFNDIELSAVSQLYDVVTQTQTLLDDIGDKGSFNWYNAIDIIGKATGIPTRNIYNYTVGMLKNPFPEAAYSFEIEFKNQKVNNKSELNEAIKQNNEGKSRAYFNKYHNNIVILQPNTMDHMYSLYKAGFKDAALRPIPSTLNYQDEPFQVNQNKWKKDYSKIKSKLDSLVTLNSYLSLSDEEKESCIKLLSDAYYNYSKANQLGTSLSDLHSFLVNNNSTTLLPYIVKAKSLNNKQDVVKYINSLHLPKNAKTTIYYLLGYKISKQQELLVNNYIKFTKSF